MNSLQVLAGTGGINEAGSVPCIYKNDLFYFKFAPGCMQTMDSVGRFLCIEVRAPFSILIGFTVLLENIYHKVYIYSVYSTFLP